MPYKNAEVNYLAAVNYAATIATGLTTSIENPFINQRNPTRHFQKDEKYITDLRIVSHKIKTLFSGSSKRNIQKGTMIFF